MVGNGGSSMNLKNHSNLFKYTHLTIGDLFPEQILPEEPLNLKVVVSNVTLLPYVNDIGATSKIFTNQEK